MHTFLLPDLAFFFFFFFFGLLVTTIRQQQEAENEMELLTPGREFEDRVTGKGVRIVSMKNRKYKPLPTAKVIGIKIDQKSRFSFGGFHVTLC